jgi:hypothetical protein
MELKTELKMELKIKIKINNNIDIFRYVDHETWPLNSTYPSFCNGYIFALKPKIAAKLAAVSSFTKLLPLDDIYVTGVLRDRLTNPDVNFRYSLDYYRARAVSFRY